MSNTAFITHKNIGMLVFLPNDFEPEMNELVAKGYNILRSSEYPDFYIINSYEMLDTLTDQTYYHKLVFVSTSWY